MTRSVFYGVSAFVGSITGPTSCTFWADDPGKIGFAATQYPFNLANNPESVRRGGSALAVEVDDFAGYGTGGLTTIGPMFPGGTMMGLCYVEDSRCGVLGAYDPRLPTATPGQPYEWCTVHYYDTAGGHPPELVGRRFHGFHANIRQTNGNLALVSLWARGTSATKPPMGTWWIDLGAYGHPPGLAIGNFGLIGIGTAQQTGALFLDIRASNSGGIAFDLPKAPKLLGGVLVRKVSRDR
jgi:hypothetical protein